MNMDNFETVNECQNYEYFYTAGRRDAKVCQIKYYFSGDGWESVWRLMKAANMPCCNLLLYAGAKIDAENKTINIRGGFRKEAAREKHYAFWKSFFKGEPSFKSFGEGVKMPASSQYDTLEVFVNGVKC